VSSALRASGQQQVRHVHARDGEQQDDSAENREQRRPDGRRQVALQRIHDEAVPKGRRRRPREVRQRRASDGVELRSRLIQRYAWRQPAHHAQGMAPFPAVQRERRVVHQERPDVRLGCERVLELSRQDADHGDGDFLDRDLPSDDPAVGAEAPAP
jgi:hypothetical protein